MFLLNFLFSGPQKPSIPPVFDCHVEANINNRNFTTDFHIWYHKQQNVAAVYYTTAGASKKDIYNFTSSQYISTDLDYSKTCLKTWFLRKNSI